jgi:hypothetical protein
MQAGDVLRCKLQLLGIICSSVVDKVGSKLILKQKYLMSYSNPNWTLNSDKQLWRKVGLK